MSSNNQGRRSNMAPNKSLQPRKADAVKKEPGR